MTVTALHFCMDVKQLLLAEFDYEMENTRKMLRSLPLDTLAWQPHEKSMSLGQLASHVAELPSWLTLILTTPEADFEAMNYEFPEQQRPSDILASFDINVREAKVALENTGEHVLGEIWTLRSGEHVIFSTPRVEAIRDTVFNHLIHHRGQLSVYLRLRSVAVPGMYGASADEGGLP